MSKTYTSAALAKELGISTTTLRNWEKQFEEDLVDHKDGKLYTEAGLQQFKALNYLLQERGFTIEGAKKEIERQSELEGEQAALIERLQELRSFLIDLKKQL